MAKNDRRIIGNEAKNLVDQVMIEGLRQFSLDGIVEAKWKIAGIANLLQRLGSKDHLDFCIASVNQLETLLNVETARAHVWENVREALEEEKTE